MVLTEKFIQAESNSTIHKAGLEPSFGQNVDSGSSISLETKDGAKYHGRLCDRYECAIPLPVQSSSVFTLYSVSKERLEKNLKNISDT